MATEFLGCHCNFFPNWVPDRLAQIRKTFTPDHKETGRVVKTGSLPILVKSTTPRLKAKGRAQKPGFSEKPGFSGDDLAFKRFVEKVSPAHFPRTLCAPSSATDKAIEAAFLKFLFNQCLDTSNLRRPNQFSSGVIFPKSLPSMCELLI